MIIPDCQFDNLGLSNVYKSWKTLVYIKSIDMENVVLHMLKYRQE